jgi:hypothetical protein
MGRRGKTEKLSVTLPRELAGEIRSIVPPGEVSSFFTEALEHYLAYHKQVEHYQFMDFRVVRGLET